MSLFGHKIYAIAYPNRWKKNHFFDLGSLKTSEFLNVSRAVTGSSVHLKHPGFIKIPVISRITAAFTHYFEIKKTIRECNIDVIILYSVATNALQAIYLAHKYGVPVVFRSIDILHQLVKYPLLRIPTKLFEKIVYSLVDLILAVTPNHVHYVVSMRAPFSKVKSLFLPIDTNLFHKDVDYLNLRSQWGLSEKDKIIVFIGILFQFCGLDSFLSIFPQIIKQIPEAKLVIVGNGPHHQKLRQIISELNLENNVIMTGLQPYNTMSQYINMADVCINPFINTSTTSKIFPGKILQYLACGKATVATPLLGITSLLPIDSNAIVYADSASEMAEKVVDLLQSPERRNQLGQAGLDYVKKYHNQQYIARQLENDLVELVENYRCRNN